MSQWLRKLIRTKKGSEDAKRETKTGRLWFLKDTNLSPLQFMRLYRNSCSDEDHLEFFRTLSEDHVDTDLVENVREYDRLDKYAKYIVKSVNEYWMYNSDGTRNDGVETPDDLFQIGEDDDGAYRQLPVVDLEFEESKTQLAKKKWLDMLDSEDVQIKLYSQGVAWACSSHTWAKQHLSNPCNDTYK